MLIKIRISIIIIYALVLGLLESTPAPIFSLWQNNTKEIQLKQIDVSTDKFPNTFALVDDIDYKHLIKWKWHRTPKAIHSYSKKGVVWEHISMHRMIMKPPIEMQVDHINRDTLDNRRCNLRICTHQENLFNQGPYSNKQYKGVCKRKDYNKWRSRIRINKKLINLGDYNTPIEAAKAYNCAARILFGEFAYQNNLEA